MTNGEAVIAKLISEVADLTKANGLLHAIVSNREEEISGLRAQLASASERVAEMQYEAGMYHSLYDVATERLASARKALEEIDGWRYDTLGKRPRDESSETEVNAAFDRGARMAFYRCSDRARLSLTSAYGKSDDRTS